MSKFKLPKLTLRQQNKILLISCGIYFVICSVLVGIFIYSLTINSQPLLIFTDEPISSKQELDKGHLVYGQYSFPGFYTGSVIRVRIDTADQTETIYHEYFHWLYYQRLTKSEKKLFDNVLCNQSITYQFYKDSMTCNEQFARGMAAFILDYGYESTNVTRQFIGNDAMFEYFKYIYVKYI